MQAIFVQWGHDGQIEHHAAWERGCPTCGRTTMWEHASAYKRFTLYWIPVAKYQHQYAIYCTMCGTARELSKEDHLLLLQAEAEIRAEDVAGQLMEQKAAAELPAPTPPDDYMNPSERQLLERAKEAKRRREAEERLLPPPPPP